MSSPVCPVLYRKAIKLRLGLIYGQIVGHVPFISKVTGNEEYLPMGISLMALPGSDLMLLDIAQACLEKAGRPTKVFTGKSMFH